MQHGIRTSLSSLPGKAARYEEHEGQRKESEAFGWIEMVDERQEQTDPEGETDGGQPSDAQSLAAKSVHVG